MKYLDKIVLALSALVFFGSFATAWRQFGKLAEIAARNPAADVQPALFVSTPASVPRIVAATWEEAPPQSRGKDWLYEVFTPPVIYYNPQTAQFTVTPPALIRTATVVRDDSPFGLDLISVRQEPYRIQLVGYVGDTANALATFEMMDTGETVVGRPGRQFERQQFSVKSIDIRKVTTAVSDSMPVIENVAVAVIVDEQTGREEILTNRERKMLPRLQAIIRTRDSPVENHTVREGTTFESGGQTYLVAQLSLNPPQAVISRRSRESLGPSETRTLVPVTVTPSSHVSGSTPPGRSVESAH